MQFRWLTSLNSIPAGAWDALFEPTELFAKHAFLLALEKGGSVDGNSGWFSRHASLWQDDQLIAVIPGYLKTHSYGEYLFDWPMVRAYEHYQLPYYPKWVSAIPFTPVTGSRLAVLPCLDWQSIASLLIQTVLADIAQQGWHSAHWFYCHLPLQQLLLGQQCLPRHEVQFLWQNQQYADFSDFLAALSSRKRKQIRQERKKTQQLPLQFKTLQGIDITPAQWQSVIACYQQTYQERSGHNGYISAESWWQLLSSMRAQIVVFAAFTQDEPAQLVAAALCFQLGDTLYGRYWGALADYALLHFECCYYQGIQYCIEHGLRYFDGGAQGEQKLRRGFSPVLRYGACWYRPNILSSAIEQYCQKEQQHCQHMLAAASELLPYSQANSLAAFSGK
ncbi:GNAT family N-acetyltransferase [Alishewanella sp. 16-MA]|uniref:GNAT family N-acetyltransferase n=1 Tax=Alishewanella maricola TaxID=2795740 RepID=A0ABS8C790_9ALTE|nr:GNAT family N-acetyltransferase [Alishewanella maricola]MCB5228161.1 GNAT family N-acetyltransferase [Alishewanella maricola]